MPAMTPEQERKLLQNLLCDLQDPQACLRRQLRLQRGLRLGGLLLLTTAFMFGLSNEPHPLQLLIPGILGGLLTGFSTLHGQMLAQWPLTAPYVDQAGVQRRLDELLPPA